MKVLVAESAGFCRGVRRAVEKARAIRKDRTGPVSTDGPLIHNRQMLDTLASEGIGEWAGGPLAAEATLLIRAHGIPPARRQELLKLSCRLEDATCPDVARIQGLIRTYARKGFQILIFGDRGHAEVIGLEGYADGRGHVIENPADVTRLSVAGPVCLVSQSTQLPCSYEAIQQAVRARYPDATVLDTICDSTRNRQEEVIRLAGQVDVIVVVGDGHSANTLRLVELARRHRPTVHIETAAALDAADFRNCRTVGLTAGASTPAFVIEAVRKRLESLEPAA